jgi:hypothetical protein
MGLLIWIWRFGLVVMAFGILSETQYNDTIKRGVLSLAHLVVAPS